MKSENLDSNGKSDEMLEQRATQAYNNPGAESKKEISSR